MPIDQPRIDNPRRSSSGQQSIPLSPLGTGDRTPPPPLRRQTPHQLLPPPNNDIPVATHPIGVAQSTMLYKPGSYLERYNSQFYGHSEGVILSGQRTTACANAKLRENVSASSSETIKGTAENRKTGEVEHRPKSKRSIRAQSVLRSLREQPARRFLPRNRKHGATEQPSDEPKTKRRTGADIMAGSKSQTTAAPRFPCVATGNRNPGEKSPSMASPLSSQDTLCASQATEEYNFKQNEAPTDPSILVLKIDNVLSQKPQTTLQLDLHGNDSVCSNSTILDSLELDSLTP